MKFNLTLSMLMVFFFINPTAAVSTDEQRQAYDTMVEEAVKEADEYVEQKQIEAAEEYTRQQDAQRREEEAARMKKEAEEQKVVRGVIVRTPPIYIESEAVTLPSGPGSTGEGGTVAPVTPVSPPVD